MTPRKDAPTIGLLEGNAGHLILTGVNPSPVR
jgi:hypothetical protein